jgi:AcrR family transcriptional regulator
MQIPRTGSWAPSRDRIREAAKELFAERGFESTATAVIVRNAGTSESQLIKHFENKLGLLEAIFQHGWEQINPALRLATESVSSPLDRLKILIDMVLTFLNKDQALCKLLLLEGRRIRDDGKQVVLVPGFLEFVNTVDQILQQLADRQELAVHPQALRSSLMGAMEGMLRDRILAKLMHYPADFADEDIRSMCFTFVAASLRK